jgi:hypothetical protein
MSPPQGTVKVPALVLYATKLANFVLTNLGREPNHNWDNLHRLYYL